MQVQDEQLDPERKDRAERALSSALACLAEDGMAIALVLSWPDGTMSVGVATNMSDDSVEFAARSITALHAMGPGLLQRSMDRKLAQVQSEDLPS